MTEAEWLASGDVDAMLECLSGTASQRKLRLFAAGCVRLVWADLRDARSREAVEVAEAYADGEIGEWKRTAACEAAEQASRNSFVMDGREISGLDALPFAASLTAREHIDCEWAHTISGYVVDWFVRGESARLRAEQRALVGEILGNPFRLVAVDPRWLTSDVVALAGGIYAERAFDRLPILADALQDAGCDNADVLGHCRDPHLTHVRGCWVVDLVLGKA